MPKYLSGREKRRPQDKLTEDRYQYLGLEQAEPNLADPATSPGVPAGAQFQLVAVSGYDGRRYWVPVGGDLQPGSITIFDEGSQVSGTSSITQLNFVGAAVTAAAGVQSPSGHPGVAATITVIPVTVGDNPPIGAGTTNNGELWWESDTGDLYVYYNDGDSSQWVMANSGGRGLTGDKGTQGDKGIKGSKGEIGSTGDEGEKGSKGEPSTVKGDKGDKGDAIKGDKGDAIKGDKGDAIKGDKGEMNVIDSNADDRVITGSDTVGELKAESKLTFDSDNVTATLNVTGNTNITGITTVNSNLDVDGDLDVDRHTNLDNVSIAGVATVSGNLFVGGVLTYEDVTNVDSVGLITARDGIFIPDDKKLEFGNVAGSGDLQISHTSSLANQNDSNGDSIVDGDTSFIEESGTGGLIFKTNGGPGDGAYQFFDASWRPILKLFSGNNARVSLYHGGTEKLGTTTDGVKIYGGLQDKDGDLGTSGQVLTSTGTQLNWVPASTVGGSVNTTYTLPGSGTDGTNFTDAKGSATITLTGTNSTTDEIVITAGDNIKITSTGSGGFTINAQDTNDNTQLTTEQVQDIVGAMFSSNTETRISATYQDSDGTIDLVVDDMTADNNTTYAISAVDGDNTDEEKIRLTGSNPTSTDDIVLEAGTGLSIARSGDKITFTNTDTGSGANTQLSKETVQDYVGEMLSGNTETRIAVTYDDTNNKINFVVDDQSSDNNTTYDLLAVQTSGNNTNPAIKLDASTGDDDEVKLVGVDHSGITVTRADNSTINFDTSLQLLARQSTSGSNADPNLDLMGSASVALDTVKLVGGTNVNIERNSSGNQITFTAQNDNTQLSTEQVQDIVGAMFSGNTETNITATYQDSDGTIDLVASNDNTQLSKETVQDYVGEMLTGNTETRIAVTYDDANNKINFVVDDQSSDNNTTYDLITSASGNNVNLKLDASSGDDDTILLTAGTNVSFTSVSSTGFTINTSSTLSGTIDEADKVKVNTSTENEYHNIAFVPKDTTTGSYQTLEIDSTDQRLAWNPSNNRLQSYDTQTYRLITWSGGSSGTAGQVLTSGGTGGWTWTTPSSLSGILANVTTSTSPPSSPSAGDLWWDSDDGDLLVYYNDGNTSQWVTTGSSGQKGEPGASGTDGVDGVSVKGQKGEPTVGVSNYQEFTQSGTWTKPSTGNIANVYMWGGGGGGGGNSNFNGGGGGGGYAEYQIPLSELGSTVTVTVGTGGGVNQNGGTSWFSSTAYQAGGGNAGHNGTNYETNGYGGNGGSPLGTGQGASRGFYTSGTTDDGTSYYNNSGASSGKDGHSGGGGGSAAGGGTSGGGSAYMAGGGGGARRNNSTSNGGSSVGGGNGGNAGSNGSIPSGGGGARASGARGLVRVVVV